MDLQQAAEHVGKRVRYTPAAGMIEYGIIKSVNAHHVFVRYDGERWSKATYPGFLTLEEKS